MSREGPLRDLRGTRVDNERRTTRDRGREQGADGPGPIAAPTRQQLRAEQARRQARARRTGTIVAVVFVVALAAGIAAYAAGWFSGSSPFGALGEATSGVPTTSSAEASGSASASSGVEPTDSIPLEPTEPIDFDVNNAMESIRTLESFGVRKEGSDAETAAAQWLLKQMKALGYDAHIEDVPLPNDTTSHNVVARAEGTSERVIVLGAHLDTKSPSPGANDNASGCAAILEIARILAEQPVTPTVEFVFFGAEEMIDSNGDHHHYGSRFRVAAMTDAEIANTAGMVSVDMIGYGPQFVSRTMLRGPQDMSDILIAQAAEDGYTLDFLKDPGASGWSDHEAYELAGIPATWIEWRDDPVYHTAEDTSGHLNHENIRVAGQVVLDMLRSLDAGELEELCAR